MKKARPLTKTKALSAALITFFISSHAFSISQINSEFELMLPRQFQQIFIDKKWETLINKDFQGNWQFPDQQTVSEQNVPVKIKNISLKMRSFLQKPALGNNQEVLQLTSKDLQAQIDIGEVSVDHVIERVVGGIIGRFRIQASCRNVVLTLAPGKGTFGMILSPVVKGSSIGTNLESFSLSWSPGSWIPQSLQCEGAQGFTDLIKAEIDKMTSDSAKLIEPQRPMIAQYIVDSIKDLQVDFSQPKNLVISRPDIQVLMKMSEYKDLGQNGASLKGVLQIHFLKAKDKQVKMLALTSRDSANAVYNSQASLRLPKDFIKEVASASYTANSWLHKTTSDKFSGFATLMNSRFYQLFIWPELRNYPMSTKFLFDVYSNKDVTILGQGLSYKIRATFNSMMQAPKGGKSIPFMYFGIPFTSDVNFKVENGTAYTTFVNPYMGLTYQWDSSYVKKYYPSQKFDADTIRDRIVGDLRGKTMSFPIPKVPVTDEISLRVLKASVPTGKQDLVFQLAP